VLVKKTCRSFVVCGLLVACRAAPQSSSQLFPGEPLRTSQLMHFVAMECRRGNVRAYRGVNEVVAANSVRSSRFRWGRNAFWGGASCTTAVVFHKFLLLWSLDNIL